MKKKVEIEKKYVITFDTSKYISTYDTTHDVKIGLLYKYIAIYFTYIFKKILNSLKIVWAFLGDTSKQLKLFCDIQQLKYCNVYSRWTYEKHIHFMKFVIIIDLIIK